MMVWLNTIINISIHLSFIPSLKTIYPFFDFLELFLSSLQILLCSLLYFLQLNLGLIFSAHNS